MLARTLAPAPALIMSFLMVLHLPVTSSPAQAEVALSGDGIVKVKSAHDFDETIELLKKDIASPSEHPRAQNYPTAAGIPVASGA